MEEISLLKAENQQLNMGVTMLNKQLQQVQNAELLQLQQAERQQAKQNEEKEQHLREIAALEEELRAREEADHTGQPGQQQDPQSDLQELQRKLDQKQLQLRDLTSKLESAQNQLQKSELSSELCDLSQVTAENAQLRDSVLTYKQSNLQLLTRQNELINDNQALKQQLNDSKLQFSAQLGILERQNEQIRHVLQSSSISLQGQQLEYNNSVANDYLVSSHLRDELAAKQREMDQLRENAVQLQETITQLQGDKEREEKALKEQNKALLEVIKEMDAERLPERGTSVAELKKQLAEGEAKCDALDSDNQLLKSLISALREENKQIQGVNDEQTRQLEALQKAESEHNSPGVDEGGNESVQVLKEQSAASKEQVAALETEVSTLTEQKRKLSIALDNVQRQLREATTSRRKAENELNEKIAELQRATAVRQGGADVTAPTASTQSELEIENASLKDELQQLQQKQVAFAGQARIIEEQKVEIEQYKISEELAVQLSQQIQALTDQCASEQQKATALRSQVEQLAREKKDIIRKKDKEMQDLRDAVQKDLLALKAREQEKEDKIDIDETSGHVSSKILEENNKLKIKVQEQKEIIAWLKSGQHSSNE